MGVDKEMMNLRRDLERFRSLAWTIENRHSLTTLHEIIREAEDCLARLYSAQAEGRSAAKKV